MTGRAAPWPGDPADDEDPPARSPRPDIPGPGDERALRERLAAAVDAADAPDVVFAVSRHGRRTLHSGGTAPPPAAVPREDLRYEIGSASKTFTGLLLARLIRGGALTGGEPAAVCLDPARPPGPHPVTLAHLITHTSGLPALPPGFVPRALPAWRTNPYARYPAERLTDAFLSHRPRHRPGTRWHYSNYGVSVLGHAVAAATGTAWEALLTGHVLRPLGLSGTALHAEGPGTDATGHRKDGRTPVPALDAGGFQAAGAVRSTPHDLLAFLEAHLDPAGSPAADALRAVRVPVLRRGPGHRHVHTVAWFRHPTDGGPMYFHSGATLGQQAFLGFRPDTGTALAAVCSRRFRARDPFIATAYAFLMEG
ncbi:putative penicillin-binding protein [Streptomyces ambofaciens ATCC 23877]|uniref:Putative penicillin-binding protein n=1 Tax=Streptomyces ambofaciens (strain ATCC 23877 / 3486 / DSM 40053 / JCM 4204 / NBRC 12836 / NRRL B-2516) TaxID=278992 RepID=A0ADM7_STRA7|nr:serine hydrolase domain-containing protein [Streptomyces ambofaciens]AKZ59747.1 putative penicillin-binding protein [Streptomyces ambofaciens ATCC 23877]CAJ88583.1 putative penicillin-binding protein [Streptomyces ambofaciens ATCC 23877]